ncbi:helix-turn-helix domain-containing protein [Sulfitobacter sp. D35]|nr:helix-turn-helix domain-containing protein [Sulfitobacter sp. D35]MDW4500617.1 helix-turn-helix domain-containing protein [Sulfitobacter sp. D35]
MPLAEVAIAAGFSSQSHMTDVFREKVGTTPGKFRAQING